jgi:hypothetical protein
LRICSILAAACLLLGCQNTKQPPKPFIAPPASAVHVTHYVGTPLSGPTLAKPAKFEPPDAFDVQVQFIGLEHMTPQLGAPVAGRARMLVLSGRDNPTMPSEHLLRGSRWLEVKDDSAFAGTISPAAGRWVEIAKPRGALPPNITASFTLTDAIGLSVAGSDVPIHRQIEVELYRAANNHLEMGISLADLAEQTPDKTDLEVHKKEEKREAKVAGVLGKSSQPIREVRRVVPVEPPVFQRELAVVDLSPLSAGGERAAVIIPIHFADSDTTAIAAIVTLLPAAATPEHVAAASRCADDLQRSSDAVANSPRQLTVVNPAWSRYRVALDALTESARRRAAMVYLASQTDAPLCRDVALAADDSTLDRLSADIRRAVAKPAAGPDPSGAELGWTLDRLTFKMIAGMMNDSKLPLELSAIIANAAGQPGRDAGSIEEVSHSLATRAQFNTRLQAENLIALEDSSMTARVRAFDWLAARGEAPPGYDPLGSRKDRRAALESFASGSNAPPTTAAATNVSTGAAK